MSAPRGCNHICPDPREESRFAAHLHRHRSERRGLRACTGAGQGRRGQAAVEFALGAMLFLILTLAIMQFAILYHMRLVVAHACREGVRFAAARLTTSPYTSVETSEAQVKQFIIQRAGTLHPPLTEDDISFTPADAAQRVSNTNIQVTIHYDFRSVVPLIAPLLPAQVTFTAEAQARLE